MAVLAIAAASWATPAAAGPADDAETFARLLDEAQRQDWDHALAAARSISDQVALSVHEWLRLRNGTDDWDDYTDFLDHHADWPGLKILRLAGEKSIGSRDDPHRIIEYFNVQPPQSGTGALRLAGAHARLGQHRLAVEGITNAWLSLPFSRDAVEDALATYGTELRPHHRGRLDNLLWQGRTDEAQAMFDIAGADLAKLARARIALRKQESGVDRLIAAIPDHLDDDPGLAFERVVWRLRNDAEDRAIELLLERSGSPASLGKPELWASRRLRLAHSLMRQGRDRQAYRIASSHHIYPEANGPDWLADSHRLRAGRMAEQRFAELEWLSGYIALRKLEQPGQALQHFNRHAAHVSSPISRAKAAYWIGVSLFQSGAEDRAAESFRKAAVFQTTFYGQLAAQRISAPTDPGLVGSNRSATSGRKDRLEAEPVVRAAFHFYHAGWDSHAAWFLAHWAERLDFEDNWHLAELASQHGADFSVVKVAKEEMKDGGVDIDHLFPLIGIRDYELAVPHALTIAVARQETEFRDLAVSPKGARGLMQIKPSTGSEVASRIGLRGNIKRLLADREYNLRIGSGYLDYLLEKFDGSYLLAIAAYNAGPARVSGWLREQGDPRRDSVDPIDWIEHVPFGETRNYIMRVMEAITVYRMRLGGGVTPIDLAGDLQRG